MKKAAIVLALMALIMSLGAKLEVISNRGNQILLEYIAEPWQITEENGFAHLKMADMLYPPTPAAPLLPYLDARIGLPPNATMDWSLQNVEEERIALPQRILPVPTMSMQGGMSQMEYLIDETLYQGYNKSNIRALEPDVYRGYAYGTIRFTPFRYDGGRELVLITRAQIRINIDGDVNYRGSTGDDELAELMLSQFVNSSQAKSWRSQTRETVNFASFGSADHWLRIETDKEGIYRLTHQQLAALPLADIDPRSFRLFSTSGWLLPSTVNMPGAEFREVAIWVIGEDDGHFDAGDQIIFYGTNRDGVAKNQNLGTVPTNYNPYSQNSIYWLTFGGDFSAPPKRMQTLPSAGNWVRTVNSQPATARLETETHRRLQWGFNWYMSRLFGVSTADYQFTIPLANPVQDSDVTLSLRLQQEETKVHDTPHSINVFVNNTPIAQTSGSIDFNWIGGEEYVFNRKSASFVAGNNEIRLRVKRNGTDNLFLDYINVDYTQRLKKESGQYQIEYPYVAAYQNVRFSVLGNPAAANIFRINSYDALDRVTYESLGDSLWFVASANRGGRFVIASVSEYYSPASITAVSPVDLTAQSSFVDHLIIAATEYLTQAQSLADMYQQFYGLSVRIADQQDILNQFNGGHPDPVGIRQFIRYVYFQSNSRLKGVTLIGLGTLDWRNFSRQAAAKNKIMVFQRGQTTSDDFYAMMSSSYHPELIIGRYPVRNTGELNNMLSNYRNYTQNPQGGWWRNSMVFLGDDLYNGSETAYENLHTQQTQESAESIHPSIRVDKIFAWEYDYDEYQNKPAARDDMMAAINEGRLVWYYIGHGSSDSLGSEDYFNGATDMGRFDNANHLPLFLAATCKASQFDHWGFESIGEKVVMLNNLGAIASLSATRMSAPYSNVPLIKKILDYLANKRNYLGYSILAGKIASAYDDNDLYYVLLGDPTLRIMPPQRDSVMTLKIGDNRSLIRSRQKVDLQGSFSPYSGAGNAEVKVFDSARFYNLDSQTRVSQPGKPLFKGNSKISDGSYEASFIVPDDITNGDTGSVVSYYWDAITKQDYTNFYYPIMTSDDAVAANNAGAPQIELYLGSMDFRAGDTVPAKTTLLARISDENGINVTGSAGHNILLVIDNSIQPIPVTQYFSYDQNSFTTGTLRYPLSNLKEGAHTVQVIAFDNFNLPAVASTHFMAKKTGELSIERLLIYPNPVQKEAHITFTLSQDSELDIGIYSISGKRLRRIQSSGRQGFNQIFWDGKDHNGSRLANNTYFVKVNAKSGSLKAEARERLVIYK